MTMKTTNQTLMSNINAQAKIIHRLGDEVSIWRKRACFSLASNFVLIIYIASLLYRLHS